MASNRDDKEKGESIVLRRCLTLAVSCCFVLALAFVPVDLLLAQDQKAAQPPAKAEVTTKATPKTDAPQSGDPAKKTDPAKDDAAKKEPAKAAEPPLPPIPPEVQAKIDAARKAVAEAMVAAQDAGLIESSIDPPPILDLLIYGRVTDARILKAPKKPGLPYGLTPEVFGAWFTGYGKMDEINYRDDVRVMQPSDGLKAWYDQRARILEQYIQEIRKTKPAPTPKKAETKPAETKPAETKPAAPPAAPETKKVGAPKAVEPKK
jgi:cytoskeletal protein RodZ